MRVSQAPIVARATRARPVMHLVPVMQARLATGVPRAIRLEGTLVLMRVVPGTPAATAVGMRPATALGTRRTTAVGTRPATAAGTLPAIEVEIPPETVVETPRVIAEA
jgi:hypothetical protein